VEDCALENFVDQWKLKARAQLRPAAAGLERSAAHPANEVGPSKNAGAQHRPSPNIDKPARGMEARRAETIELQDQIKNRDGLGSRQPGPPWRGCPNKLEAIHFIVASFKLFSGCLSCVPCPLINDIGIAPNYALAI
jgi:hypothetical protein